MQILKLFITVFIVNAQLEDLGFDFYKRDSYDVNDAMGYSSKKHGISKRFSQLKEAYPGQHTNFMARIYN